MPAAGCPLPRHRSMPGWAARTWSSSLCGTRWTCPVSRTRASPGRLVVRDPSTTGDAILDAVLEIVLAYQGKRPSAVLGALSKNLRQMLYERLADSGVVRAEPSRILGVVRSTGGQLKMPATRRRCAGW